MKARIDPTFLPLLMNSSQVAASDSFHKSCANGSVRSENSGIGIIPSHAIASSGTQLSRELQSSHHEVAMRHDQSSIISGGYSVVDCAFRELIDGS